MPVDLDALVGRVVHAHVVGVDRQGRLSGRVVDDDVGVGARGNHALLWVEPKHPGRGGRAGFNPALQGELTHDHPLVDEVHAVLDAADPVRDGPEVVEA